MKKIDADRARQLAWAAVALYLAGLGIAAALRTQGDFGTYYLAGHRAISRLPIYPPDEKDRFLYAPVFAVWFGPFSMLPRHLAQFMFFLVNAYAFVAFVIGAGVMLFGREHRLSAVLIVVPVLLASRFIDNNIEHGQATLIVLAMCVWSIVYARESSPIIAGAMLAASVLIKPFAALVALYLLLRGKFSAIGWALAAGIVLIVAPVLVFGAHGAIEQTAAYLRSVGSMTGRYRTMLTNQSAVAWLARSSDPAVAEGPGPLWIGMAFEVLLIAIESYWIVRAVRSSGDPVHSDTMAVAGLFCIMPGFAPISWKSYYVSLLVPYMALMFLLWECANVLPKRPLLTWSLFIGSLILNFAAGRNLNRFALYHSAHFFSSLLAFMAVSWGPTRLVLRPSPHLETLGERGRGTATM